MLISLDLELPDSILGQSPSPSPGGTYTPPAFTSGDTVLSGPTGGANSAKNGCVLAAAAGTSIELDAGSALSNSTSNPVRANLMLGTTQIGSLTFPESLLSAGSSAAANDRYPRRFKVIYNGTSYSTKFLTRGNLEVSA